MSARWLLLALVLFGCAGSRPLAIDVDQLKGPWFSDGPSFELVIQDTTILFEFDMTEHVYRLEGDVLVIQFDEGIQRKRILRLTEDRLELQDEQFDSRSVLYRKGIWERSPADDVVIPK